jgi:pimeloyl-ACP methyl ester carboxylesterase
MALASVNGLQLYYETAGEGLPVVFAHEFAGDYRSWEIQVRFFSRFYRCIAYNHRGYPPSSVPGKIEDYSQDLLIQDLGSLLDHLRIDQAYLVGFSLGGNVVLNFALRYPEVCRGIVVVGAGAGSTNRASHEERWRKAIDLLRTRGIDAAVESYSRNPIRLPLQRKDPRGWAEFLRQFGEHSAEGLAFSVEGVQMTRPTVFSLKQELNSLPVPTLVMVGDEDDPCLEPSLFLKREIPSAGLQVFPQSGHAINLEEPTLFNQEVFSFLHAVESGRWAGQPRV